MNGKTLNKEKPGQIVEIRVDKFSSNTKKKKFC